MSNTQVEHRYTEAQMVSSFLKLVQGEGSPWQSTGIVEEFDYGRGRTDVVVATHECLIAIEAILSDWRRALDQAYRNTCFAEQSYVLLPATRAKHALRFVSEFEARGVGLCCIEDGKVEILYQYEPMIPIEPWLTEQARQRAAG